MSASSGRATAGFLLLPRPPRDAFERVVAAIHSASVSGWLATPMRVGPGDAQPHSKGARLDNLAVAPSARGRFIGQQLVQALLQAVGNDIPAMVSLTTHIPSFFSPFGFQPCGQLADGSTALLILLPSPAVSEPLTHDDRNRRPPHRLQTIPRL